MRKGDKVRENSIVDTSNQLGFFIQRLVRETKGDKVWEDKYSQSVVMAKETGGFSKRYWDFQDKQTARDSVCAWFYWALCRETVRYTNTRLMVKFDYDFDDILFSHPDWKYAGE